VNINNPLGLGDVASFRLLTSGRGLTYGRASYQAQLGKAKLGVAYSALEYEIGKEFASLQAHGTAQIGSIYGNYPLIRSRNTNLYACQLRSQDYQDKVDSVLPPANVTDKTADVWMFSSTAATATTRRRRREQFFAHLECGRPRHRDPSVRAADALTARRNGHYGKLAYSAARLQNVTDTISLYAGINGRSPRRTWTSRRRWVGRRVRGAVLSGGRGLRGRGLRAESGARWRLPKFTERLPGRCTWSASWTPAG